MLRISNRWLCIVLSLFMFFKNRKNLRFSLRMSKKSSNFAADFEKWYIVDDQMVKDYGIKR